MVDYRHYRAIPGSCAGHGMSLARAAAAVRARISATPEIVIILGSGLARVRHAVSQPIVVEGSAVPGFPPTTVDGHRERLVFGSLGGRRVMVVQGRVHLYEGAHPDKATFSVQLGHELGARRAVLTCSAGGISAACAPGNVMLIRDHIRAGLPRLAPTGVRPVYDQAWGARLADAAQREGSRLAKGTYLWTLGPCFETPAEIRSFARMGADAVGMSTVPEAMMAAGLGMTVLGLALITNPAAGLAGASLSHEEVLSSGRRAARAMGRLVELAAQVAA